LPRAESLTADEKECGALIQIILSGTVADACKAALLQVCVAEFLNKALKEG